MPWPKEVEEYLNTLCAQVRWKRARALIRQEYGDHIQDRAAANQAAGMEEGPAYAEALRSLGDGQETGLLLDASYRPQIPWALLSLVVLLTGGGLLLRALALNQPMDGGQALGLCLGVAGFFLFYTLDWRWLIRGTWWLWGAFVLGALLYGLQTRGLLFLSLGWPSCLPSLLLLFPAAYGLILFACREKGWKGLLLCLAALCFPLALLCLASAYTVCLLLAVPCLILLTLAILSGTFTLPKPRALALTWGPGLLTLLLGWALLPNHIVLRLQALLHPQLDPQGLGYLPLVLQDLRQGAQFFGPGQAGPEAAAYLDILAQSQAQYGGASRNAMSMEYALDLLMHRYGWWVCLLLLGLLVGLFYLLLRGCRRQTSPLARLLAYAITLTLAWEFGAYILANFLGYPLSPLPLPFLTYGNSALAVNLALMGLLTSILAGGDIQEAWACRAARDIREGRKENPAKDAPAQS